MKRILGVVRMLGLALLVAGCESNDDRDPVVITAPDAGHVVRVDRGDEVEVILPGNPTTGYRWEVSETDASRLPLVNSSYRPGSDLIGAGGEFTFTFKAAAAGEVHLQLVYKRAWESTIAQTFAVTIQIQ